MNYLTALLAFSAIMIVLATLATVVVEGLHKLNRQRAKDFEEMLTNLFARSIQPRLQSLKLSAASEAEKFAREIVENPAFSNKEKGFFRKLAIFSTDFDELSTQQFVEQFAQTKVGRELKEKISKVTEKKASELLEEISADFERFGEAATSYFQRRAHVLSVLVAFLLAFTINIDAIKLYSTLAKDTTLSEKIVSEINVNELQKAYEDRIEKAEGDEDEKEAIEDTYKEIRDQIRADASKLEELGLPIGHTLFPYCAGPVTSESGEPEDKRCKGIEPVVLSDHLKASLKNWPSFIEGLLTYAKAFFVRGWMVITSQQGIAWLFSASLAGGLIGLGAPFWFKTYRFLANFIPGFKTGSTTQLREDTSNVRVSNMRVQTPAQSQYQVTANQVQPAANVNNNKDQQPADIVNMGSSTLSSDRLYKVFRYAVPEQTVPNGDK